MPDNPYSNPLLAAIGGPMAQAWQSSLEAWWKALLSDSGKLGELAAQLAKTSGLAKPSGPKAEDVSRIIEALELMEKRLTGLEGQLEELTKGLASVVGYLERQSNGPGGGEEAKGGPKNHGKG